MEYQNVDYLQLQEIHSVKATVGGECHGLSAFWIADEQSKKLTTTTTIIIITSSKSLRNHILCLHFAILNQVLVWIHFKFFLFFNKVAEIEKATSNLSDD